ncbi:MAG TPA: hypothetical protein VG097_12730 [Gemmata sp.]|jgi:hypothetical protein|nr:hypothetical protein [Gemmata sp.]
MGASVIHGRRLSKQRVRYPNGSEAEELVSEEGDSVNMAYSSVARMVEFCAARGVSQDEWPIYYGVWQGDVDLADVAARCERLRQALITLGESEGAEITWLDSIREWLNRGEHFAVFE